MISRFLSRDRWHVTTLVYVHVHVHVHFLKATGESATALNMIHSFQTLPPFFVGPLFTLASTARATLTVRLRARP